MALQLMESCCFRPIERDVDWGNIVWQCDTWLVTKYPSSYWRKGIQRYASVSFKECTFLKYLSQVGVHLSLYLTGITIRQHARSLYVSVNAHVIYGAHKNA